MALARRFALIWRKKREKNAKKVKNGDFEQTLRMRQGYLTKLRKMSIFVKLHGFIVERSMLL
jgi:hypothetical protein